MGSCEKFGNEGRSQSSKIICNFGFCSNKSHNTFATYSECNKIRIEMEGDFLQ